MTTDIHQCKGAKQQQNTHWWLILNVLWQRPMKKQQQPQLQPQPQPRQPQPQPQQPGQQWLPVFASLKLWGNKGQRTFYACDVVLNCSSLSTAQMATTACQFRVLLGSNRTRRKMLGYVFTVRNITYTDINWDRHILLRWTSLNSKPYASVCQSVFWLSTFFLLNRWHRKPSWRTPTCVPCAALAKSPFSVMVLIATQLPE